MDVAVILGAACAAGYLVLLILRAALSAWYLRRHPETETVSGSITVLQPVLGGDPDLKSALEQNLRNAPNEARFLWLVDQDDRIGLEVARLLQGERGDRVRILECPPCPDGKNPKTYKLGLASPEIQTEYAAVLDDDAVLSAGHLGQAIAVLTDCELYTGLPCYDPGATFWSSLLAHFVNNNSVVTYLTFVNWMPPISINGMFYVLKQETLARWQGWNSITAELCDDYAFAKLAQRHGGRIRQGVTAVRLHTTVAGWKHYLRLMHRWFVFAHVLVLDQSWRTQLQLFVFLGLPPLLLWGSLLLLFGGWIGGAALAGLLVTRHLLIRSLQRAVIPGPPHFSWWRSVLSELLQVVHDIHAWISPVIIWRTRRIRVRRDGTIQSLPDS